MSLRPTIPHVALLILGTKVIERLIWEGGEGLKIYVIQSHILLKTWTKVELSCQNDANNRNIESSITIASWEISDGMFLNLGAEKKKGMHVTMATEKRTKTIKLKHFLEIMKNSLFMLTLKTRS